MRVHSSKNIQNGRGLKLARFYLTIFIIYAPATSWQKLAHFWHPPPVTVRWTLTLFLQLLVWWRSLGQAETIELSASSSRRFPGILRCLPQSLCVKILSLWKPGPAATPAGVVGQTQDLNEVMCTCRQDCSAQPASRSHWQQNRSHSRCAVVLCKACAPKRLLSNS